MPSMPEENYECKIFLDDFLKKYNCRNSEEPLKQLIIKDVGLAKMNI
jgi:hypothetical protein